jgi:hypothetical protein
MWKWDCFIRPSKLDTVFLIERQVFVRVRAIHWLGWTNGSRQSICLFLRAWSYLCVALTGWTIQGMFTTCFLAMWMDGKDLSSVYQDHKRVDLSMLQLLVAQESELSCPVGFQALGHLAGSQNYFLGFWWNTPSNANHSIVIIRLVLKGQDSQDAGMGSQAPL